MCANRLLAALIWVGIGAIGWSQDGPAKLLLPHPVVIRGMVVDAAGHPIPDVGIDYLALTGHSAAGADSSGHFECEAKGPSVVFRKGGWKSLLVRVSSMSGEGSVVLERAVKPEPLPVCSKRSHCVTAGGIFCLPKVRGVDTGDLGHGIDAFERQFTISSLFRPWRTMIHGSGSSWGGPEPREREVWDSIEFSESQREVQGLLALDARGKTSDGKLWRWIGQSGESVFYFGQEQKDAMLFDRVLDGLCVLVPKR
jgi:hypothetical protein